MQVTYPFIFSNLCQKPINLLKPIRANNTNPYSGRMLTPIIFLAFSFLFLGSSRQLSSHRRRESCREEPRKRKRHKLFPLSTSQACFYTGFKNFLRLNLRVLFGILMKEIVSFVPLWCTKMKRARQCLRRHL
jgi:hypothetical protein